MSDFYCNNTSIVAQSYHTPIIPALLLVPFLLPLFTLLLMSSHSSPLRPFLSVSLTPSSPSTSSLSRVGRPTL